MGPRSASIHRISAGNIAGLGGFIRIGNSCEADYTSSFFILLGFARRVVQKYLSVSCFIRPRVCNSILLRNLRKPRVVCRARIYPRGTYKLTARLARLLVFCSKTVHYKPGSNCPVVHSLAFVISASVTEPSSSTSIKPPWNMGRWCPVSVTP